MFDVLKLKLRFVTEMFWLKGQIRYQPDSVFPFWFKPPHRVPLFYRLGKACSAYPWLVFLLRIMWKGHFRDSSPLALAELTFPLIILLCVLSSTINRFEVYFKVFFRKFSIRPYWEIIIMWHAVFWYTVSSFLPFVVQSVHSVYCMVLSLLIIYVNFQRTRQPDKVCFANLCAL